MVEIVVDTTAGALRGIMLPSGVRLFAGVPFAAPPTGPLRFRPPVLPDPWSDLRNATSFPPMPAQGPSALVQGTGPVTGCEDCLYLNIWMPKGDGPHPVLVWIYGGGFDSGSASPPDIGGDYLARRLGAVVVAVNYRLGALGWLYLADLGGTAWAGCSNLGLQDQTAALRWVTDNIAAFGGAPDNVTVAGESAGAFSIGALLATPAAKGLFARAILQSGSTSRIFPPTVVTRMTTDLLDALGLDDLDDLLTVDTETLINAQSRVVDSDIGQRNLPGGRSWGVVLDGTILPVDPHTAVEKGAARHVELLVGANRDEVRLFEAIQGDAFRPDDDETLMAEMARAGVVRPDELMAAYRRAAAGSDLARLRSMFLTDAIYRVPALRLAHAQVAAGGSAYLNRFSGEPYGATLGACHAADLAYVFGRLTGTPADTPENRAIADQLIQAWAEFIRDGDPGWAVYDAETAGNTRQFGGSADTITETPDARTWRQP